jgi:NitT/TauT family transport system substrate-binding protein
MPPVSARGSNARIASLRACAIACLLALVASIAHAEAPIVRVGVLKFGTLNWELDVMRRHGLDRAHGFALKTIELAGKDGAAVALQGGAVDVILTDWLWVAQRRANGGDFTFAVHSHASGGLMVRRNAGIAAAGDLAGKRFGVGGGAVDKSWLIFSAYAKKMFALDLRRDAEPVFAAPPLLNEILKRGELPAAVNFWQYNARLPESEFVELLPVETMLEKLEVPAETPLLGFVFNRRWASEHQDPLRGFLAAAAEARDLLAADASEWQAVAPQVHAEDPSMLERLRQAYRRGVGKASERAGDAAARLLTTLHRFGELKEALPGGRIPDGTFFAESGS